MATEWVLLGGLNEITKKDKNISSLLNWYFLECVAQATFAPGTLLEKFQLTPLKQNICHLAKLHHHYHTSKNCNCNLHHTLIFKRNETFLPPFAGMNGLPTVQVPVFLMIFRGDNNFLHYRWPFIEKFQLGSMSQRALFYGPSNGAIRAHFSTVYFSRCMTNAHA